MKQFAETTDFISPYYPQANGQAEWTVHTVENLFQNAKDPYMALLSYHATSMQWCDLSPADELPNWGKPKQAPH